MMQYTIKEQHSAQTLENKITMSLDENFKWLDKMVVGGDLDTVDDILEHLTDLMTNLDHDKGERRDEHNNLAAQGLA